MRSEGIRPPGAFTGRSGSVSKQGEPSPRTRGSSVSRILANTGRYRDMEARTTARGVQINAPPPPRTVEQRPVSPQTCLLCGDMLLCCPAGRGLGGGGGGETLPRVWVRTHARERVGHVRGRRHSPCKCPSAGGRVTKRDVF